MNMATIVIAETLESLRPCMHPTLCTTQLLNSMPDSGCHNKVRLQ